MDIKLVLFALCLATQTWYIPSAYSHRLFCYHIYNEEAVILITFTNKMAIKFCLKGNIFIGLPLFV